jgi:hypothetical protein
MSFSGRYPEHDICENFNAIDVRELQRKNLLRPGLCFTYEWFRNGAPSSKIFIITQPDAIMLVYRAGPPGAAMAGSSLPRPPALHQLHLGRTGPIGPDRCQYNLLNPRRGIMMRIMQPFHTRARRRRKYVFQPLSSPSPQTKNEMQFRPQPA